MLAAASATYLSEDVSYPNPSAKDVVLAGTLTKPPGAGPFPAVLMVTGSGPQDRDETILGHKPFRAIADSLSTNGFAVLRVDDRGVGRSTGNWRTANTVDFMTDSVASVRYLQSRADIDPKRIGLLGHSEGAMIAAVLAAEMPDLAFTIMLAAPAVRGNELVEEQNFRIQTAMGWPSERAAAERALLHDILDVIQREPDNESALREIMRLAKSNGKSRPELVALEAQLRDRMLSPWFRFFIAYDPQPFYRKLKTPLLALYGDIDMQVPAAQNAPVLRLALQAAGNRGASVRVMPGLNHLFQHAKTGAPAEYATLKEDIAPEVLGPICEWLEATISASSDGTRILTAR